jgi:hypothetical protein
MKFLKIITTVLLFSSCVFAITPLQIAKKTHNLMRNFKGAKFLMEMTLINSADEKIVRKISGATLEKEDGDKSLTIFLSPADVKGTKLLTHKHNAINKDDDQWLYLPALRRIKRISSKNKSGSFMGSEFAYEDITIPHYTKFQYEKGEVKKIKIDNIEYFEGVRIPKNKNSGYTKQYTLTNVKTNLIYIIKYFDKKKELLKTATFEYKNIKGLDRISKITMINHQSKKSTILKWLEDDIKLNLSDNDFNKRILKR